MSRLIDVKRRGLYRFYDSLVHLFLGTVVYFLTSVWIRVISGIFFDLSSWQIMMCILLSWTGLMWVGHSQYRKNIPTSFSILDNVLLIKGAFGRVKRIPINDGVSLKAGTRLLRNLRRIPKVNLTTPQMTYGIDDVCYSNMNDLTAFFSECGRYYVD